MDVNPPPFTGEERRRASAALMRQVHASPEHAAAVEQFRDIMPGFDRRLDRLLEQLRALRESLPDADPAALQGIFHGRVIAVSDPEAVGAVLLAAVWRLTDPPAVDLPAVPE